MANYFRITAYNPTEDICVIMDSNGLFEQIWQFSSLLVKHGFDIHDPQANVYEEIERRELSKEIHRALEVLTEK